MRESLHKDENPYTVLLTYAQSRYEQFSLPLDPIFLEHQFETQHTQVPPCDQTSHIQQQLCVH